MAIFRRFLARHGLDNNNNSITNLGAANSSLAFSGGHSATFTTTGATTVTLPTAGTLATLTDVRTWEYYVSNWSVEPAQVGTVAAGAVWSYTLGGVTRFRLVPTTYSASQDAFYTTFSGGVLSGFIVSRG